MPNQDQETNAQPDTPGTTQAPTRTGGETPPTWEAILETLPDETQAIYESHTQGLRSALDSERQAHRDLARQLREATEQLEAGSEARNQLEALQGELEELQRQADFATEANTQGVANVRLAYLAAQEFETFDRRGNVQWDALREAAPELFRQQTTPRGNAGAGTQAPGNQAPDIDSMIRRRAGVRT